MMSVSDCLQGGVVIKTVMECNKKTFWWFQALMGACKRCKSAMLGPQEKVSWEKAFYYLGILLRREKEGDSLLSDCYFAV